MPAQHFRGLFRTLCVLGCAGLALRRALANDGADAAVTTTPIAPGHAKAALTKLRRKPSDARVKVAVVHMLQPKELRGDFVGLLADFSAPLPEGASRALAPPQESDPMGCSEYRLASDEPFVAVVRRGNCTFVAKAQQAQRAGARGIIVVSDTDEPVVMGTGNSTAETGGLSILAIGVQRSLGDQILSRVGAGRGGGPAVAMSFSAYASPGFFELSKLVLLCMATGLIVLGAFFSTGDLREDSPLAAPQDEVLEVDTAMSFGMCVMGSGMLVFLYFSMQYMIYVIIFIFCAAGAACITQFGSWFLEHCSPRLRRERALPLVGPVPDSALIASVPGGCVAVAFAVLRNTPYGWFFQDILGAGFLCSVQRTLRLPNIKVATLLLVIMFFFDIFWVFVSPLFFRGKSVMVTVATGGDTGESVPMLLRVPTGDLFGGERILGFGDIVLPGLLISYLRRHDILSKSPLLRGYFAPSVAGYFLGLCATFLALEVMRMGQPALLYLVPGTLGTTLALARNRGELLDLWEGRPSARRPAAAKPGRYGRVEADEGTGHPAPDCIGGGF
mmetsp:Transcript_21977/g.61590  ORF Transcript_21977/g.61590 Transcript_21977/m.61590 type:complete len:559 (-) Transcript_21977:62-1738(-)